MPHLGGLACDLLHNDVPRFHCHDAMSSSDLILHATIQNVYLWLWDQIRLVALQRTARVREGLQTVITID